MQVLLARQERLIPVERERRSGRTATNRCGRDFLYYALHYYCPHVFDPQGINPVEIERRGLFGLRLPSWLMWTQLQFVQLPSYLRQQGLSLYINETQIKSYADFVRAILFSRFSCESAVAKIETSIRNGNVTGVDLSLGYGGLLDHVLFVYGYDDEALYVLDTHKVQKLEYTQLTEEAYRMRLPRHVIKERWTRFGRVWEVIKDMRPT